MTDYYHEARKAVREFSKDTPRRRSTDVPQPLDYPTRELVRDIVEDRQPDETARKPFIRRLLDLGRRG